MSERNPPSDGQEPDQSTLDQLLAQVFEDCHEWRTEQEDKGHVALDNECRKYCYRTMANLYGDILVHGIEENFLSLSSTIFGTNILEQLEESTWALGQDKRRRIMTERKKKFL